MPETPPSFANYLRNECPPPGSADRLQALMEGYYGYSPLLVIHVVLSFALVGLSMSPGDTGSLMIAVGLPVLTIGMGCLSYRANRKVGEGAGWSRPRSCSPRSRPGLGTLCCGAIGCMAMQPIAAKRIKRFGVRSGFFGMRKKKIQARIDELRTAETAPR